jgi:hypothetical protein
MMFGLNSREEFARVAAMIREWAVRLLPWQ